MQKKKKEIGFKNTRKIKPYVRSEATTMILIVKSFNYPLILQKLSQL